MAKTIIAIVCFVAAIVILGSYFSGKSKEGSAAERRMVVSCDSCQKACITMVRDLPAKCKYCGKPDAWVAAQCADCNAIFPIVKGRYDDPASRVCPKCGKSKFRMEVSQDGLEER